LLINKFTPGQNRALTAQLEKILVGMVGLNGR
jgi:D-alanyl-D-alanine carboxypeptidase/D-alanyl-D-alanine-endopeptidase (penicillin-binding protein 4)